MFGCLVPDDKWDKLQANCDPIPSGLTGITQSIFYLSGLVGENGPVDFYVDDVKLGPFQRDRSWIPDANLRIEDIRKRDLVIDISGRNDIDSIMLKMTKSEFYWGATMDQFMMGGEVTNIDQWFDLFNLGVARNEFKWEHIYRKQSANYGDADQMLDLFESKSVPIRGHVVFWSVDGHSPDWFEAMTDLTQKEEIAWAWVDEVINRYKNRLINWDVFNEIIHGDDFVRMFGFDFWDRVLARIRQLDPAAGLAYNDFELLSNGKGKCFLEYVGSRVGDTLDFYGLQSHMKKGINGQVNLDKLNQMAYYNGVSNRLWITEFDVDNPDVTGRAEDVHDFIRSAYSHPNVDALVLWTWLREKHRPWQDVPFNRALWENPDLVIGLELTVYIKFIELLNFIRLAE